MSLYNNTGIEAQDEEEWLSADEIIARRLESNRKKSPEEVMSNIYNEMHRMNMRRSDEEYRIQMEYLDEIEAEWWRRHPRHKEGCKCPICSVRRMFPPESLPGWSKSPVQVEED